jgi:hypothetical protein
VAARAALCQGIDDIAQLQQAFVDVHTLCEALACEVAQAHTRSV